MTASRTLSLCRAEVPRERSLVDQRYETGDNSRDAKFIEEIAEDVLTSDSRRSDDPCRPGYQRAASHQQDICT